MPKAPVSPLNEKQLEVLTAWVEAGGPDKPKNPSSEDTNDTELAHHQGYNTFRTMKDPARCPNRPKTLACIVKH